MKRFLIVGCVLLLIFSASFLAAERAGWTDEAVIRDAIAALRDRPLGAAAAGAAVVILLAVDLLLPVPSSIVMTMSGVLFGVLLGTALSFTGAMLAAGIGFYACRRGGQRMFQRLAGDHDVARIDAWFQRYGIIAIILSRPVPMLTEILSCLAGLTDLPAKTFFLASGCGTLPVCALYAYFGAVSSPTNPWPALTIALLLPAAGWLLARHFDRP